MTGARCWCICCWCSPGGGEACTDIEHLRSQRELFGTVGSHSTLYRALRGIDGSALGALWGAAAKARGEAWSKRLGSGPLVVDIDSTLVEVHSENKQGAAPHYKGGYGFGPMICSTGDGEPLWAKLRPGNAAGERHRRSHRSARHGGLGAARS